MSKIKKVEEIEVDGWEVVGYTYNGFGGTLGFTEAELRRKLQDINTKNT